MLYDPYFWLKSFHLIFVIAWVAAMLIFPRYKLHQIKAAPGDQLFETMKDASSKLRKIVLTPSMLLVWVLGLALVALEPSWFSQGWFHVKLLLVLGMTGLHGYFVAMGRKIDNGDTSVSAKRLKMMNEVPFVLMAVIVILVIVKPF